MRKYKHLTKPNKHPKKFIQEIYLCVKKKRFMSLSFVVRDKKIIALIREFNETPIEDMTQRQVDIMDAIYQACVLIDDYNELFFKDIKVKFIDPDEFMTMRRKFPYAKLHLRFRKSK